MSNALPIRFAMHTDIGRVRSNNEDACAAEPELGLFVVCDGMGGHAGGEVASREVAAGVIAHVRQFRFREAPEERLAEAIRCASRTVFDRAKREPRLRGMGSTVVALQIAADGESVSVAHAGDSRCYLLRGDRLRRLTTDHSLVEEQVQAGLLTPEQARHSRMRNVITRVAGSRAQVEPEVASHMAQPGDLYLMCSDGLNRDLADADLLGILQRHRLDLSHAARVLVDAANLLGGGDNITVALVEIGPAAIG